MKLSDDITPRGEMTLQFRSNFAAEHGKPGQAKAAFCRAVEKCKEYILAGDIFQVVLSRASPRPPKRSRSTSIARCA